MVFAKSYTIEQFQNFLYSEDGSHFFTSLYGSDTQLLGEKLNLFRGVIDAFGNAFPEAREAYLLRIPGRINLMGVHIDHRGGWCNYMPIAREIVFCFSPRDDDKIVAKNIDASYPDCEFSITEEIPETSRGRWMEFIEGVSLERGHWGNYLKAGALKLQDHLKDTNLKGFNVLANGDIPSKSGLSSSSTLVVGAALALRQVNRLSLRNEDLVELCGEGEWYTGTRGGAGDHSAMLLGKAGSVTHTGFKPLSFEYCPFPEECGAVLCHSGLEASKATNAREIFNSRIAAYETAFLLYRHAHPEHREALHYLRDISSETLGMDLPSFYRSFTSVPVSAFIDELKQHYPDLESDLDRVVSTYGQPKEALPLRETLLFGVTECARARLFARLLREQSIEVAGRLMYISHDGDRVTTWKDGQSYPYRSPFDDEYLEALAEKASVSPQSEESTPAYQPGGYRCSVPELDRLVDQCKQLDGVYGAGLTGAGLGGAILVLVRLDCAERIVGELRNIVQNLSANKSLVELCRPVPGAGLIQIDEGI